MKKAIVFLVFLLSSILYSQSENIHMMNSLKEYLFIRTSHSICEVKENHLIIAQTRRYPDSLMIVHSYDNGITWEKSIGIFEGEVIDINIKTLPSQRIVLTYRVSSQFYSVYSDDDGLSWSVPTSIGLLVSANNNSSLIIQNDAIYLILSRRKYVYYFKSSDGITWGERTLIYTSTNNINSHDIVKTSANNFMLVTSENIGGVWNICSRTSSDLISAWSDINLLFENQENLIINNVKIGEDNENKLWVVYEAEIPIMDNTQSNLFYLMSEDNGVTWGVSKNFTKFLGNDTDHRLVQINGKLFVFFQSERFTDVNCTSFTEGNTFYPWIGRVGYSDDTETPPYVSMVNSTFGEQNDNLFMKIKVRVFDENSIQTVHLNANGNNVLELFDDGMHSDDAPNDSIYGNTLENINTTRELVLRCEAEDIDNNKTLAFLNTFFYNPFAYDNHNYILQNYRSTFPVNESGEIGDVYRTFSSYDGLSVLYSGGFALTGYSDGVLWGNGVMPSSMIRDYVVGTVGMDQADPKAKLYLLENNKPPFGEQWQAWADAVQLGAKFYDGDGDGAYNPVDLNANGKWDYGEDRPDLLGDQTVWSVMNDGQQLNLRTFSNVSPQGIEVRQTIFTFNSVKDVYFVRYEISNSGTIHSKLDSVYFSFFLDPDLGDYRDDLVSTNLINQAVCVYNDGVDNVFGEQAPTEYTMLLQGPCKFVPNVSFTDNNGNKIFDAGDIPLDTAKVLWGELVGSSSIPGALNQSLVSSNVYFQSHPTMGDPNSEEQLRNYMLGFDQQGNSIDACNFEYGIINGVDCNDVDSRFIFSGDPLTNTGWLDSFPTDVRYLMNVGPFSLKTNEPQTIIAAFVFARGENSLKSIEKAREKLVKIRNFYESNFKYEIVGVNNNVEVVENFYLSQNYPNPFNPNTMIKYGLPEASNVKIEIFNTLGQSVCVLVNSQKQAGYYETTWNASNLPSGIYFINITAKGVETDSRFTQVKKALLLK